MDRPLRGKSGVGSRSGVGGHDRRRLALFEVKAGVGKNRLLIVLAGDISVDECEAFERACLEEVGRLRPDFDLVSDVSGLEPLGDGQLERFERTMKALLEYQRGRVVRVVGRSTEVALQLERVSRRLGFSAYIAFSASEAERLLDGDLPFP